MQRKTKTAISSSEAWARDIVVALQLHEGAIPTVDRIVQRIIATSRLDEVSICLRLFEGTVSDETYETMLNGRVRRHDQEASPRTVVDKFKAEALLGTKTALTSGKMTGRRARKANI